VKILALTPLRFLAAIVVVIFHYGKELSNLPRILFQGPEMVTFFFVLSGFVLAIAYLNRPTPSLRDFMISRVARIAPIYLVALLLVAAWKLKSGEFDVTDFFLCLFFLQSWFAESALALNSPGWSISVEMFFYAMFPITLVIVRRYAPGSTKPVAICALIWFFTQAINALLIHYFGMNNGFVSYFPPLHLVSFLLGISGGKLFFEKPASLHSLKGFIPLLLISILCVISLSMIDDLTLAVTYIDSSGSLCSPLFLLLILAVATNDECLSFLKCRYLIILGEASYALYILQAPVYGLFKRTILPMIGDPDIGFLCYCILLVAISVVVHFFLEVRLSSAIKRAFVINRAQRIGV